MIGVMERVKNNVLMKCSNLNDSFINGELNESLDRTIYQFAESLSNLILDFKLDVDEDDIRSFTDSTIKVPIMKKIKRKLFIDSLALQITNDTYIENYINKKIDVNDIYTKYIKELSTNKKSNQLNMTEDLDLTEIMQKLTHKVDEKITNRLHENEFVANAINSLLKQTKDALEKRLISMNNDLDNNYLNILVNELQTEVKFDREFTSNDKEEGEDSMMPEEFNTNIPAENVVREEYKENSFAKYDDMTLYNKMILGLNTKEEKLSRCEAKLAEKKAQIEDLLAETNKKIEANVQRENMLSQRRIELNSKEKDLNARLSEAELIFLNMKPLIKGLNNIKEAEEGGSNHE